MMDKSAELSKYLYLSFKNIELKLGKHSLE